MSANSSTMLAITASKFTDPSKYELSNIEKPSISHPEDVLVQVHAASINPVDVKIGAGAFKPLLSEKFPIRLGYDCAGTVIAVGEQVKDLKVGDHVWSRLPEADKGSWGEFVKCSERHVSRKPESLSFAEAASLPLAALTALQALSKYKGSLSGKTVFVPAGLGGTGAFACQLAKNVFQAGKVITTVSTSKVPKVPEYLGEGVIDQIIDYTKEDPLKVIPKGSVDFMLDTMGQAMSCLSLMTPQTSTMVSISTTPSGSQFQNSSFCKRPDKPRIPWVIKLALDGLDAVRKARARRWHVDYTYMFLQSDAKALDQLRTHVQENKIRPVIGSRVPLREIDQVREACLQVYNGKGGVGKCVFIVREEE